MTSFQFDAKNAEDYERITRSITDALKQIAGNPQEPATKASLAKVSGVHRLEIELLRQMLKGKIGVVK